MSQQGPGGTPYPPPPPPYRPPYVTPPRRLTRSRTNRRWAGVLGGLGEYLGADALFLRVAYVVVSFMFLAGIGGLLLYVIAALVIPEEGVEGGGPVHDVFSVRPWHDWDRTARSWAIVLGTLTLAVVWSFGLGPGLHWRALPVLLVVAAVSVMALRRFGPPGAWGRTRTAPWPQGPQTGPVNYPGGTTGPVNYPGGTTGPGDCPGGTTVPSSGPGPQGFRGAQAASGAPGSPGFASNLGPLGPRPDGTPPAADPATQEAADWAQAQSAAAGWVQEQLAAAGVATIPPGSSAGPPGSSAGPPGSSAGPPGPALGAAARGARHHQRRGSTVVAVMAALLLMVVIAAVSLTLGSGSSLRGGIGDDSFAPATLSTVATQYRLGIGDLDVNLSAVSFPPRGRTVTMSVGIGELTIVVPRQATVYVNAHAGVGDVQVLGVSGSTYHGRAQKAGASSPAGHLTINAHVGIGEVQVTSA